jgi:hypothetical protein
MILCHGAWPSLIASSPAIPPLSIPGVTVTPFATTTIYRRGRLAHKRISRLFRAIDTPRRSILVAAHGAHYEDFDFLCLLGASTADHAAMGPRCQGLTGLSRPSA